MCARTSAALGPVYVITPVELLYASDPSPPESVTETCALTSAALGPVYVITPVELLYANEPSPPASVTLMVARASAVVYCVIVVANSPPLNVIPVPALRCALTSEALGPVYVITPVELL